MNSRQRFLLDTQTLIDWGLGILPDVVRERLDSSVELFVSIVSFWECLLKPDFRAAGITINRLEELRESLSAAVLSISLLHLRTFEQLPYVKKGKDVHKDPFDRLIIAQALSEKFILVGKDGAFPLYRDTPEGRSLRVFWKGPLS